MFQQPAFKNAGGRRADRQRNSGTVQFRSGSRRADVQVCDISTLSAQISGVLRVHEGDQVHLKLGELELITARVAWVSQLEFGCEFARPLSAVVLASITR